MVERKTDDSRIQLPATLPVLINDRAGALRRTEDSADILAHAEAAGLRLDLIPTTSARDLRRRLAALRDAGCPVVVVGGGDGTLHEAAQILAYSGTALGILPQGTANNFATALGVPLDLPSALRTIGEGNARRIDLGMACAEYFTESAGIGLFADALSLYGPANKNLFRALSAILKILLSLHATRIRLTIDGKQIVERAVMCTAANTYRMAYALPVAPDADLTDSQLDIVILGDLTRSEVLQYYRAMRAQAHLGLPKAQMLRGRHIVIESAGRMPLHADDRIVCTTPATVEAKPRALSVLLPASKQPA